MKRSLILSLTILGFAFSAQAKKQYLKDFEARYPNATIGDCQLCHGDTYKDLNNYGKDFAQANNDFEAIEGKDSDGDGFTNLEEITADTLPYDNTSSPTQKAMMEEMLETL